MDFTGVPENLALAFAIIAAALVIVDKVLKWVKGFQAKKNGDKPKSDPAVQRLENKLDDLIDWHQPGRKALPADVDFRAMDGRIKHIDQLLSKVDADGVPMVYTRKSIYNAIDRIVISLERQATNQELIIRLLERMEQRDSGG